MQDRRYGREVLQYQRTMRVSAQYYRRNIGTLASGRTILELLKLIRRESRVQRWLRPQIGEVVYEKPGEGYIIIDFGFARPACTSFGTMRASLARRQSLSHDKGRRKAGT